MLLAVEVDKRVPHAIDMKISVERILNKWPERDHNRTNATCITSRATPVPLIQFMTRWRGMGREGSIVGTFNIFVLKYPRHIMGITRTTDMPLVILDAFSHFRWSACHIKPICEACICVSILAFILLVNTYLLTLLDQIISHKMCKNLE